MYKETGSFCKACKWEYVEVHHWMYTDLGLN